MCSDKLINPTFTIAVCGACKYKSVYGPDRFETNGDTSMNVTYHCRRCGKKAITYLNKFFYTYEDALDDIYGVFYINGVRRQFGTGEE